MERPETTDSNDFLSSKVSNKSFMYIHTFSNTDSAMLLCFLGEGVCNCRLRSEERLIYQAVQSLPVVVRLDLGEDRLDGVELWAVAHVVDWHNIRLS